MKRLLFILLTVMGLIGDAYADFTSDTKNYRLSLLNVAENAVAEGMSISDVVSEMILIDPTQSWAIVVLAIIMVPDEYTSIIYGSDADKALLLSEKVHSGYVRLGLLDLLDPFIPSAGTLLGAGIVDTSVLASGFYKCTSSFSIESL